MEEIVESPAVMQMVVEDQNQANHPFKRIKLFFIDISDEKEEDRISDLPDGLLVDIISRLFSTKGIIQTGILSKRWEHLWTLAHNLIFLQCGKKPSKFVSDVDKTLTQCRQTKLKQFRVYMRYNVKFESQVNNWIRFAVNRKVEALALTCATRDDKAAFLVDQFFFVNSSFTYLNTDGFIFKPAGAISWGKLTKLLISHGNLSEDLIENILSGSPLLKILILDNCYGYKRLDITSKSVTNLVFSGYRVPEDVSESDDLADIIEINAPYLLSLTIEDHVILWKLLLLNVSSLVKAELDYIKCGHFETTKKEAEEEMLKGFILKLRHVKELTIGNYCYKALSRLEAKGFSFPSNLKVLDVTGPDYDSDSLEAADWSDIESLHESDWSDSDSTSTQIEDSDVEVPLLNSSPRRDEVN